LAASSAVPSNQRQGVIFDADLDMDLSPLVSARYDPTALPVGSFAA
jgi:hypothetical protein